MSYFRRNGHFLCDRCDEHGLLRLLGHSFGAQMGHRVGSRTLKRAKVAVTGQREAEKGCRIPKKEAVGLKKAAARFKNRPRSHKRCASLVKNRKLYARGSVSAALDRR